MIFFNQNKNKSKRIVCKFIHSAFCLVVPIDCEHEVVTVTASEVIVRLSLKQAEGAKR